ncbi:hypothetical protein BX600DRAFT_379943 [Xylariales sp. PMI_506]|nr:hypothetical protein BX600DRAFT_379943 [Xylariales sp. PMI_506]
MDIISPNLKWLDGVPSQKILSSITPTTFLDAAALAVIGAGSAVYALRKYTWDRPDPYEHIWYERPQADGSGASVSKITRNIVQRLDELGRDVVIFWGSQSGTSEGFANRLGRELHQRFGKDVLVADFSEFDAETIGQLPETKTCVFILSTYGEGDPSDNACSFWDWATKINDVSLKSLRYAAFGLGNSDYKHYNRVVDVVDQALANAGAHRLLPVARADDAQGKTEEDFLGWKDEILSVIAKFLHLEQREMMYEPELAVIEDESLQLSDLHLGEPINIVDSAGKTSGASAIVPLKILESRQLFTNSARNCLHLELDLSNQTHVNYKTGDHLAVWAMNPDEEVERLIRALGLSARRDIPILIKATDPAIKLRLATPTTTEALFRHYLEICAPVSRDVVRNLAAFAPSVTSKHFLLNVSSEKETFAEFVASNHVNLGRLLHLAAAGDKSLTWSTLPLSFILEVLPRMQPRYYSISSSSIISPRVPSITALVSSTPLSACPNTMVPGIATDYLHALTKITRTDEATDHHKTAASHRLAGPERALEGGKIFAHIRRSKFKLPTLASCPLIMVAAGTGLAPFRAFIAERARLLSIGKDVGDMVLFFGCRQPDEDFIYREELEELEKALQGRLKIVTAFSRLATGSKTYVQDRLAQHSVEVARLLNAGASFYICGRASMAREVSKTVDQILAKENTWEEAQVKEWASTLKRNRKWQEDVWG